MNDKEISNRHPFVSLFYIFSVVAVGFLFLGPSLGMLFASPFYEGDLFTGIMSIRAGRPDPKLFTALMIVQGTAGLFGLVFFPLLYLKFIEQKSLNDFLKKESNPGLLLVLLMAIGLCFTITISPVIEWNMNLTLPDFLGSFERWARHQENSLMELTLFLTTFSSVMDFLIGLVVVAVIPSIGEELVFRGLIQNEINRGTRNIHVAIWVSAFLFSAIHMQFFGLVPRMLLGALFGYLYHWSGNLLVPVVAHFFHNGFTLFLIYAYQQGLSTINPESNDSAPLLFVLSSPVAVVGLLYYFRKLYTTKNQTT
ncbi:CPBP family intramembrane metalloprotease [Oscillatoria amoena NRMC-F 0135]|nr:CPBP family intramembrane metalloprotease [Oscillatoria amoena NRMC-F 0135]